MGHPTLRQLMTFLAAVDSGSITSAAKSLHLTQPAASQQLRDLERALGVRLLDRAKGRIMPTRAGEAVVAAARRAQSAADDIVAAVAVFRDGTAGRVRVGTGATACIYLLPAMLARVKRRMPALEVTVATGNTPEILDRLEAGALDIALVTLPMRTSRAVVATKLAPDPLLALLPKALVAKGLARAGAGVDAAQLGKLPLILYEAGSNTRRLVDDWFERAGVTASPIMELGSVEAIKVLVASGLGASVLPKLALQEVARATLLHPLRPALTRDLAYVLRKDKVIDRGLRVFLDELARAAGKPVGGGRNGAP
ncbi:MAG TPA: LysR family transcriptional regulator [Xanthobacteraceae bacterium]|nr:LysR family transcriptional regulator [Xanthobacteraceae bacterium]